MKTPWARLTVLLLPLALGAAETAHAMTVVNYYSPLNQERARRRKTDYIILHTTEGPLPGAIEKLHRYGEAHYLVDEQGRVYRIVHRERVALHAGYSMWDGVTNLDLCSLAVEVVGYHDRDLTEAQYQTLKTLVGALQNMYRVPDERVLTHCMVAYGLPNQWFERAHRGRKRCGLLFATQKVRTRLELDPAPACDPDVRAGRLIEADRYLARALYRRPGASRPAAVAAAKPPAPPQPPAAAAATAPAPPAPACDGVLYLLPDGAVRRGEEMSAEQVASLPATTRVLQGYSHGGAITAHRSAFEVCGVRWNAPDTVYRLPNGQVLSGADISEKAIPSGTMVFIPN